MSMDAEIIDSEHSDIGIGAKMAKDREQLSRK